MKKIVISTIFVRIISIIILTIIAKFKIIPCFDCSAHFKFREYESLVRWDTLHFFSIKSITRNEQHFAFSPALFQLINSLKNFFLSFLPSNQIHIILISSISFLASLFSVSSSIILYYLTWEIFDSIEFAKLTTILHILSPSPSTQVVAYTEPFFAFFSFSTFYFHTIINKKNNDSRQKKMLSKFVGAGLSAFATSFRSLGILHVFLWWFDYLHFSLKLFFNNRIRSKKLTRIYCPILLNGIETIMMTLITMSPFLYDQWIGFNQFCEFNFDRNQFKFNITSISKKSRPWCFNSIPSIYQFVQSHYWGVGFLKYWTWNQFPLFILSFPIYLITMKSLINYYKNYNHISKPINSKLKKNKTPTKLKNKQNQNQNQESSINEEGKKIDRPFLTKKIEIYAHIQLILTFILLFNSHVQIILRQASTMPFIWWGLADQVGSHWNWWSSSATSQNNTKMEEKIIFNFDFVSFYFYWLVIWWPISLFLWAGFYPPA